MRLVVLDVNVLISGLAFPGTCRTILHSLAEDKFTLVLSPGLLEDFLRAIEKPKIRKWITAEMLEEIISLIHMKALIVEPKIKVRACRDPDDDAVLEAALSAKAGTIVTGDKDLLELETFKGVSIISPATFLKGNING